ncbi:hypothetical protein H0H93_006833 [Arthromyces matolae]|nr:hypothetical protein H0H93_006833 [Arthromyces matolae]
MKLSVAVTLAAFLGGASARSFTVYNACPFTIWPALFTDLNVAPNVPSQATGWEAPAWSAVTFQVPDNWKAGRIWGRRDCDFSTNPGPNSCLDGGCNGGLLCDPHTGTGVPPATVAEFTFQGDGNQDWYDVSLVDGYNLPMRITNNVGCPVADCPVDLGPLCPSALQGPYDSSGFPVGCKSACPTLPIAARDNTELPQLALPLVLRTTPTSRATAPTPTHTPTTNPAEQLSGPAPRVSKLNTQLLSALNSLSF